MNVSSCSSLFTAPGVTTYSMSKNAVTSLTDGLRREMRDTGIQVIEVIPQAYLSVFYAGVGNRVVMNIFIEYFIHTIIIWDIHVL